MKDASFRKERKNEINEQFRLLELMIPMANDDELRPPDDKKIN